MAQNSINGKRFSTNAVYALSGKVYCDIYGSKLEANSYKGGRGGNHQYRTYRCSGRRKGLDCDFKPKDKDELEMNVSLQLERDVFNVDMIEKFV